WLAQLVARMDEAEGERAARWQTMLVWLLKRWPAQEVEPPALLRELAERPGADQQRLREAATLALLHCVIGADQIADERIVDLVREKLAGDRPSMNMLSLLAFRNLEQFPEQVDLLFHQHPAAQLSARRILGGSSNGSVAEVYGLLRDRIAHPKTPAEAIAALRALVVVADRLNPQQQTELGDMLAELLSTSDDPNILAPALIAYARVQRLEEWQAKDTVETGAGPRSAAETAPLRKALELVPSERRQIFGG
ncbi:MAG TPA: hypothetical protein PKC18_13880, partial [Lacipirellulaceae bacterium]|nr:hypothetical protein [Lacipirellulaceae bacterium]